MCVECFISASSQKTAAAAKSSAAEKQHHTPPKFTRHRKAQAIAARKKTDGKKIQGLQKSNVLATLVHLRIRI